MKKRSDTMPDDQGESYLATPGLIMPETSAAAEAPLPSAPGDIPESSVLLMPGYPFSRGQPMPAGPETPAGLREASNHNPMPE